MKSSNPGMNKILQELKQKNFDRKDNSRRYAERLVDDLKEGSRGRRR